MKLSIIIPFYNVEPYFEDCLESIFYSNEDSDECEVILVNDGSPDNSMAIAEKYAALHGNVRVLEQNNQGLSAARMNGLALAKGDYVWFVDSDDWLLPEWFPKIMSVLNDESPDLCITPLQWIYEDSSDNHIDISSNVARRGKGKDYLRERPFPIYAAVRYVIRRELFEDKSLYFPRNLLHEDEYFGRVLLYCAKSVRLLDTPAYAYRIRGGSITTVPKIKSSEDILKIHDLLMAYCESNVRPEDKKWFQKDALTLIRCGFTRNEKIYSTKEFKSFRKENLRYILREYKKYGGSLSAKKWLSDISLFIFPRLHTRLFYLFESLRRGK